MKYNLLFYMICSTSKERNFYIPYNLNNTKHYSCQKGPSPVAHYDFAPALDILSKTPISHSKINNAVPPVTKEW